MADEKRTKGPADGSPLPAGAKIGRYEVRQTLASSEHATVYSCYDRTLERHVAIKQISPKLSKDPEFSKRFRAEIQVLARVAARQAAIVTVYELLEEPNGMFVVMELAEGDSLETMLAGADGPIEPRLALQILWRVAAGLHDVHAGGMVHGDLNPRNIIVSEGMRVKITGFGVSASQADRQTIWPGTAKYTAPEVFAGDKIDARADIYSLGFMVYEMLAGRERFEKVFAAALDDQQLAEQSWIDWHCDAGRPAPPLQEANPSVPVALSGIIGKMIAKRPADRFDSMDALGRTIKLHFSARSKAAAVVPLAARPPRAEGPSERPAGAPGGPAEPGPIGPPDEADQFEIVEPTEDAPARGAMASPRTKAVLGVIGIVGVLAIGMVLGRQIMLSRARLARSAAKAYDRATANYQAGRYEDAGTDFGYVRRSFPAGPLAGKASVMVHLAAAQEAIAKGDWAAAEAAENAAKTRLAKVQADWPGLGQWAGRAGQEIAAVTQRRLAARAFAEAMSMAQAEAEAGRYEQARAALDQKLTGLQLTAEQEARQVEFLRDLALKELNDELTLHFAHGDELVAQERFAEAEQAYQQVRAALGSGLADVMTPAQRQAVLDRLEASLAGMVKARAYRRAMQAADAAAGKRDKQAELAALREAIRIRPGDDKAAARARGLSAEIALAEGRGLAKLGELEKARAKFEEVLKLDPEGREARQAVADIDRRIGRQQIMRSAEEAFQAGRFSEALAKYQQAAKISIDPDVTVKLTACRFQVALAAADELRDRKKYDEALAAYEDLRKIKPDEADVIDSRQGTLQVKREYDQQIAKGDQALAEEQWARAIKHYRRANQVIPGPEAKLRIAKARYTENLTKGKAAMERKDLAGANAYFKTARKHLETKELDDLIRQVEQMLQAGQ